MSRFTITEKSKALSGFKYTEIDIKGTAIPDALHDFHFVQISDPHFGVYTSAEVVEKSIQISNSLAPNVILLTGDYVHVGRQEVRTMMYKVLGPSISRYAQYRRLARRAAQHFGEILETIPSETTILGIWGNHDYLEGKRTIQRYLPERICWLENQSIQLNIKNHTIVVSGLDDYRLGNPDIKQTVTNIINPNTDQKEPVFKLFLSHNPDAVLLKDNNLLSDYHLMLSGHTHGGQICLPGSIPLKTETKQRKLRRGKGEFNKLPVYISNGIGCSGLPLRLFCPPEIVSIRLKSK